MEIVPAFKDNTIHLKNSELKKQTDIIFKAMTSATNSLLVIAKTLNNIDSAKLYEADGFSDIYDYAEEMFNYRKAMTNNLVRIGRDFIEVDGTNVRSILSHEDVDYSASQLQEVLSIKPTDAKKLDESGVIKPEMTTKEIRSAVKAFKNGGNGDGGSGDNKPITPAQINRAVAKIHDGFDFLERLVDEDQTAYWNDVCNGVEEKAKYLIEQIEKSKEEAKKSAKASKSSKASKSTK